MTAFFKEDLCNNTTTMIALKADVLGEWHSHPARCEAAAHRSLALVTALAPRIGYLNAAKIAKESLATGRSIQELVLRHRLLDARTAKRLLDPYRLSR